MGKVKDHREIEIENAAGNFLSEQPEGSFFGAYLRLVDEVEKGNGKDLAANHVTVWQKLENTMSVEDMVQAIETAVTEPSVPEFLEKIDWKLLRKQKLTLLETIDDMEKRNAEYYKDSIEDLTGILHLIDSLQDYAVDDLGIDESEWDQIEIEEKI